jgi:hypothetical protein
MVARSVIMLVTEFLFLDTGDQAAIDADNGAGD